MKTPPRRRISRKRMIRPLTPPVLIQRHARHEGDVLGLRADAAGAPAEEERLGVGAAGDRGAEAVEQEERVVVGL